MLRTKAKPTAQAPSNRIACEGTRARGEILANVRGKRPSRAIAKGIRATARLSECSAPNVESIMPIVSSEAPPAPSMRTITTPATEDASGTFATACGSSA
jgi:hypothetical protein